MFLFRSAVRSLSHCNLPIEPINVAVDNNLLNGQRRGFAAVAIAVVVGNKCGSRPSKGQSDPSQLARSFSSMQYQNLTAPMSSFTARRNLCTHEITKSLTLYSNTPRNVDKDPKTLRLKEPIDAPLVLIFGWLMARKKHLAKYVKLYTDQGYDALAVDVTPWQMLWPVKGSQLVAGTVVKFLENNPSYDPMVIHGFSVGGYVFGEVLVHMARDMKRYQPILDRFVAQVWDSAADITEIPAGFPKAVFPKNDQLQKVLRNYIQYHLKAFHQQATVHYIRASQMFHFNLVKAPTLFFLSKNDPIGAERSNLAARENYERSGIKVTWKCWDKSNHVQHFQKHPKEYKEYLLKHLQEYAEEKIAQKKSVKV